MKKNNFATIGLTALLITAVSCSKSDSGLTDSATYLSATNSTAPAPAKAIDIQGTWTGTYSSPEEGTHALVINFQPNGDLQINISGIGEAHGNWELDGNTVKATYFYMTSAGSYYTLVGTVNGKSINGTIGFRDNTSGYAVFSVSRE